MKVSVSIIHDCRRPNKEGKFPVKLRVTYLRKQYYYGIMNLTKAEFENTMRERPKKEYQNLRLVIDQFQRKAWNVIESIGDFSFMAFENHFLGKVKEASDVYGLFDQIIASLKSEGRLRTAISYECSRNSIKKFSNTLSFKDVTSRFLSEYEIWALANKISRTTVGIYLRAFRAVINTAIERGIISKESYPFGKRKYVIPAGRNLKKALTMEEISLLWDFQTIPSTKMDYCKKLWFFSYLANGMNIKDIALLKRENIEGEFLRFTRAKTQRSTRNNQQIISVFLLPEAQDIISTISEHQDSSGFLFPILKEGMTPKQELATIQQTIKSINKYLNRIAQEIGITKHITSYTARHSFATILKQSGVGIEFISESLGHASVKTTASYLDSFLDSTRKTNAQNLLSFSRKPVSCDFSEN